MAAAFAISPFYPVVLDQTSRTFRERAPQAIAYIIAVGNLSLFAMHIVVGAVGDILGITGALHLGALALLTVGLGLAAMGALKRLP